MKSLFVVTLIIATVALGLWCWAYTAYRETNETLFYAQSVKDSYVMNNTLSAYESSTQFIVLSQIERFGNRHKYAHSVEVQMTGQDASIIDGLSALFTDGTEPEIAFRTHYNYANTMVDQDKLEVAKNQYIKALSIRPDDLQAKINLELLLREIARQKNGKGNLEDLLKNKNRITDVWLRKDIPNKEGDSEMSKRVWR